MQGSKGMAEFFIITEVTLFVLWAMSVVLHQFGCAIDFSCDISESDLPDKNKKSLHILENYRLSLYWLLLLSGLVFHVNDLISDFWLPFLAPFHWLWFWIKSKIWLVRLVAYFLDNLFFAVASAAKQQVYQWCLTFT